MRMAPAVITTEPTMQLILAAALGALSLCMIQPVHAELAVGKPAPDFELPDAEGTLHRLSSLRGRWVVVYFYPKNDTPGCTAEACNLRDRHAELVKLGATLLGISVDSPRSHAEFAKRHTLPFTLLADEQGEVAGAYDSLLNLLIFKMAKRNTFLIAPDGTLQQVWRGVDPKVHADELVKALRSVQSKT
jgi:peroxiredoxin Q/BCP